MCHRRCLQWVSAACDVVVLQSLSASVCGQATPDKLTIIEPGAAQGAGAGQGVLHRHRKTPSSPARLVSGLGAGHDAATDTTGRDLSEMDGGVDMSRVDLLSGASWRVNRSTDSGTLSTSLRRGRPNTLGSGLPSPLRVARRSLDAAGRRDGRFASPEKCELLDCGPCAFDTSPILRDAPPPVAAPDTPEDGAAMDVGDGSSTPRDAPVTPGDAPSTPSDAVAGVQTLSGHDEAFIHESMLTDTAPLPIPDESPRSDADMPEAVRQLSASSLDGLPVSLGSKPSASSIDSGLPDSMRSKPSASSLDSGLPDSMYRKASASSLDSLPISLDSKPSAGSLDGLPESMCSKPSASSLDSGLPDSMCSKPSASSLDSGLPDSMCSKPSASSLDSGLPDSMCSKPSASSLDSGLPDSMCSKPSASSLDVLPDSMCSKPSASSLDSGLPDSLARSHSKHSVLSCDSGVDCSVADRHPSPLRLPSSPLRRTGSQSSPLRVPGVFVRSASQRRPHLPISTDMLRNDSVSAARCRLSRQGALREGEARPPLRDRNTAGGGPGGVPTTPTIKPPLMVRKPLTEGGATPRPRPRNTLLKPVKRLHGSPHSPYSGRQSPLRYKSPVKATAAITTHSNDWNI